MRMPRRVTSIPRAIALCGALVATPLVDAGAGDCKTVSDCAFNKNKIRNDSEIAVSLGGQQLDPHQTSNSITGVVPFYSFEGSGTQQYCLLANENTRWNGEPSEGSTLSLTVIDGDLAYQVQVSDGNFITMIICG